MGTQQRWLPYLGDAVLVRVGHQTLTGAAAAFDASLVRVEPGMLGLAAGQPVETTWWVGFERRRAVARIEEVDAEGSFSVRLVADPGLPSRRTSERLTVSVPLLVTPTRAGSLGDEPRRARSVDVSDGGLRAVLHPDAALSVGELVQVDVDLGQRVEHLVAAVAWTREQTAGLHFRHQVDASAWQQLISA